MFLFYLFIFILNIIFSKNEKLIFVELLSRHGARAPIKLNDDGLDILGVKWNNTGELTSVGKRMEYLLGVYNRHRYISEYGFISPRFEPHQLVVYSSDINRTLLSITSQLQGFYPISKEIGDTLNEEQYETAFPPFNISFEDIEKKINDLNDSALPNYMTVIPIHFIALKNTTTECTQKVTNININNANTKKTIIDFVEDFNKKFAEKLNIRFNRTTETKYNFSLILPFYDAAVADLTEGNNITNFFLNTSIDKNPFIEKRYEVLTINFRDFIFGDDNNEVILFYDTPLFRHMINNMKRKIEDDINGNPSLKNVSDFSRPKMVIISAHDTTLSAFEMFFIRFFGLKFEQFEFPSYTSQISFEITRDDNIAGKKLKYSDYKVSYYFNDKLLLNITFDKFVEKIEKNLWNNEKMDRFCFGDKKESEKIEATLIIIIIMGFIILILVIAIIFFLIKLTQKTDNDMFGDSEKDNRLLNDDKK